MTEDPEVPDEAASAAEIDLIETAEIEAVAQASALEKCTKQCAPIVEKNAKYLSNQVLVQTEIHDQSTVEIVTKTTKNSRT